MGQEIPGDHGRTLVKRLLTLLFCRMLSAEKSSRNDAKIEIFALLINEKLDLGAWRGADLVAISTRHG
ncbi:hypothetical protein [Paracoccus salsus]|uniref:hypothetical protein n=1 Tax=Paracoccus salsus TaxID=2911061 RepID=UPI001F2FA54B|nr:hypothetical protein [Paracoccus salsus]MCF3974452.1 hypothetical protein [Paracoccus salsus]